MRKRLIDTREPLRRQWGMMDRSTAIPPVVLGLGVLGLVPFVAPPLAGVAWPATIAATAPAQAIYAALILSFLGGARWGLAVADAAPSASTVALAMLPTLAAWALVMLLPGGALQLAGMAGLMAVHWGWDAVSPGLPAWYPRLRGVLTIGAVSGLVGQALLMA